ncbi:MAG TPA: hypothetical protein VFB41_11205 [Solirubrobacteraceae bacterium]|nr:hypothetical protein [Solirubrobacteraceae bacterium]
MFTPRRVFAVVLVATAAMCGVATAATVVGLPGFEPKNEAAAQALERQRKAYELINKANQHVYATLPSCKPKLPTGSATATHDIPSQAILDAIAPLRRAATPADGTTSGSMPRGFGSETYVDYTRRVTAADGTRLTIVIARSVRPWFKPTARCLDAQHARLVTLLSHESPALRSAALRAFAQSRKAWAKQPEPPATPQDGIYLFTEGGGGGGGGIASFRERGNLTSFSGGKGGNRRSTLHGLVPDGVATVTLEYPKTQSRGPYYKPAVYPSAYSRTVHVQQNVFSVHVPRGDGAFPPRMVWRNAAGTVIHVYKEPQPR